MAPITMYAIAQAITRRSRIRVWGQQFFAFFANPQCTLQSKAFHREDRQEES